MGILAASLYAVLDLKDNLSAGLKNAAGALSGFGKKLGDVGGGLQELGGKMAIISAPIAAGLGLAAKSAIDFQETMTNTAAVLGATPAEIKNLSAEVLKLGGSAREGPQAVAAAFYDIVGGVSDASSRMSILEAAIATSEAGAASLAGTTKALISVMNSYSFSAEKAGFASDVLTRTVGMGVGTMDEFAAALPTVAGLANSVGISFDDLGGMMAYITTKGFGASEAATQLRAMMTALLNPNEKMKAALKKLGYESGQAAIQQKGLVGVFKEMKAAGFENDLAGIVGSTEALSGVITLTNASATGFLGDFKAGVDGATKSAQEIQLGSFAAQFDLLKSAVSEAGITIGSALLPVLMDVMTQVRPVVESIAEWIRNNPGLVSGIVQIAGAVAVASPIVSGLGTVLKVVGAALSPIGLLLLVIGGLLKFASDRFGGLENVLKIATTAAEQLVKLGLYVITDTLNKAAVAAGQLVAIVGVLLTPVINWVKEAFNKAGQAVQGVVEFFGQLWAKAQEVATAISTTLQPVIQNITSFFDNLKKSVDDVIAAVQFFLGMEKPTYGDAGDPRDPTKKWLPGQAKARGGPVSGGAPYLVGEQGPELFVPSGNGLIVPAGQTRDVMQGRGGGMGGGGVLKATIVLKANGFEEHIYQTVAYALEGSA